MIDIHEVLRMLVVFPILGFVLGVVCSSSIISFLWKCYWKLRRYTSPSTRPKGE